MSEITSDDQVFNNMRTVGSLCNEKCNFLVPAYQRGYRWTPDQVKDLLNDIDENMKVNKKYCLQPLVIKKQIENEQVIYELIDGQQRLTTIFLILCALSDAALGQQKSFILSFDRTVNYKFLESGDEKLIQFQDRIKKDATFFDALRNVVGQKHMLAYSGEEDIQKNFNLFWKELQDKDGYDNIDRVYLLQALNTIINYYYDDQGKYRRNDGNGEIDLISHIKNNFYFLWYETEDTAETAFSRLNSGKISLNNADLIKALLLRKEHLIPIGNIFDKDKENDDKVKKWLSGWLDNRRTEIISQWDNMEQILRSDDDRFWNFIADPKSLQNGQNNYFSRLEIIFTLQMGTREQKDDDFNQQFRIYRFFEMETQKKLDNPDKSVTDEIWSETVRTFNAMREWYEDHELYHYIGYLSCVPVDYITGNPKNDDGIEITEKDNQNWLDVLIRFVEYARVHSKDKFRSEIKKLAGWTVQKYIIRLNNNLLNKSQKYDLSRLLGHLTYNRENNDANEYEIQDREFIKYLLLLCNVQELITSKNMREADHKFPFKMLKAPDRTSTLTLEHIFPQNPEFEAANNQIKSCEDLLRMYTNLHNELEKYGIEHNYDAHLKDSKDAKDYIERIVDLWQIANGKKCNSPKETKVSENKVGNETDEIKYPQRFYNLTLLPHGINASLSNHVFPEKRAKLLDEEWKKYVPLSTQNVFLKRYSWRLAEVKSNDSQGQNYGNRSPLFWLESDAVNYRNAMVNLLSPLVAIFSEEHKIEEEMEKF